MGWQPTPEQAEGIAWNRAAWDERVPAHWESHTYRTHAEALRAGGHGLEDHVLRGVGDVRGKSLIHLQCHMGMETLAWARLGADAVGVDFSRPAIDKAEHLRDEIGLNARFVCANVYDVPELIDGTFDVVFVSIGSLCWLPDLPGWINVVAGLLKPGGKLFLNDVHPLMEALDDIEDAPGFALTYPYLGSGRQVSEDDGTYVETERTFVNRKMADWVHPLGAIVTGLIEAGLRVERLEESARCVWPALKAMEMTRPGRWEFPEPWRGKVPAEYTLIARRT